MSSKTKHGDGVEITIAKYQGSGWTAIRLGNRKDIFAVKGEGLQQKVHYIRVFTTNTNEITPLSSEENNIYIQNAFSNMAVPVYSNVYYKDLVCAKVILTDINLNKNLRILAEKKVGGVEKKVAVEKKTL
jgi:hypothetical protein